MPLSCPGEWAAIESTMDLQFLFWFNFYGEKNVLVDLIG
jgi:hypothetical protein